MKTIILAILKEVDEDIAKLMLEEERGYVRWSLLTDPTNTILNWQRMRDDRKRYAEDK